VPYRGFQFFGKKQLNAMKFLVYIVNGMFDTDYRLASGIAIIRRGRNPKA